MFLFKKNTVVLDCFTYDPAVFDVCKVDYSKKFFPDWWKALPTKTNKIIPNSLGLEFEQSTIRRCVGLNSLFNRGLMIPMWSDLKFKVLNDNFSHYFSSHSEMSGLERHPREQYGPAFDNFVHAKLLTPWVFKENTGVSFAWTQPSWNLVHHKNNFLVPPAVVDFKYQHATHVNMFLPKGDNEFMINCGEPVVHLIPLTEKNLVIKRHLISQADWASIISSKGSGVKFINKYKFFKDSITDQEQEKKGKCPFGFDK